MDKTFPGVRGHWGSLIKLPVSKITLSVSDDIAFTDTFYFQPDQRARLDWDFATPNVVVYAPSISGSLTLDTEATLGGGRVEVGVGFVNSLNQPIITSLANDSYSGLGTKLVSMTHQFSNGGGVGSNVNHIINTFREFFIPDFPQPAWSVETDPIYVVGYYLYLFAQDAGAVCNLTFDKGIYLFEEGNSLPTNETVTI